MATTWTAPKTPPPFDGSVRCALANCTTGSEVATAGAQDGIDCRDLGSILCNLETAAKAVGTIDIAGLIPGDTVTVGGVVFTAVKQDSQPSNVQFKVGADLGPDKGDDWITAANLAAALTANGVGATISAFVSSDTPRVTVQALADGVAGNAITLASSNGARAAVSGATLAGGLTAGVIGAGASLQFSGLNPMTGRWNRFPDLDQPLVAGLASQSLPPIPIPAYATRLQAVPNNVGVACAVYMNGAAGRIP